MSEPQPLPIRRADLVIRDVGRDQHVVKEPACGKYFRVGPVEHFLLMGLDGTKSAAELCAAFETRFQEPLSTSDLDEFVELMRKKDLLASQSGRTSGGSGDDSRASDDEDEDDDLMPTRGRQSWLFFRKSLFDPDRLLNVLEPMLRWAWTPAFAAAAATAMLAALFIVATNRHELVAAAPANLGWSTVAIFWITVVVATMLHEFAHGLTCKHFGGEVHEIGVLMIFFTPCMYCNVSDAWLMPKRSHRIWITFAGGYCDLCVWALAVFVWRFTFEDSLISHVAWVTMSVCGGRILINLNPFTKMDGYYLLSDLIEAPNLRSQARSHLMGHVRWALWGAPRPESVPRGAWLLAYGVVIWCFAVVCLDFLLISLLHIVGKQSLVAGLVLTLVLLSVALKRVFKGFFASEFHAMLTKRPVRTACWVALLAGGPAALFAVPMQSTATGEFEIRPGARVEVHSPVSGFVRRVLVKEGDVVACGQPIAELEVPDLTSLIVRKEAEIRETNATLSRLRAGTRPEVLVEQRSRVRRAEEWRNLAERDLQQAKISLEQDLLKLDLVLKQHDTEIEFSKSYLARAEWLHRQGALSGEQLRVDRKKVVLLESQRAQAEASRSAREADGCRAAAAELARREKELADVQAALALLEAGSRPEEIEAEVARLARLEEELKFLHEQESKLVVTAPTAGVIATPRMSEKIGQLAEKGALICILEDPQTVEVEIRVPEDDVPGVAAQQEVLLKSRALPFENFMASVDRIAPTAALADGQKQSTVRVYCRVENESGRLKSGMTGFARIVRSRATVGSILVRRALKVVRTEFWW